MHSIRPRPICRAYNTFSPSIALWQHFVAPSQHLPQRLLKSSFTSEATRSRDDENGIPGEDREGDSAAKAEAAPVTAVIQKVRTGSGAFALNPELYPKYRNREKKVAQMPRKRHEGTKHRDNQTLLAKAYDAFDSAKDYEGVVVEPIQTRATVAERELPWVLSDFDTIPAQLRLEKEIQAFHTFVRPNQAESVARKHVIEQVRRHVREFLPGYVLEVFGSERTGIAFAASDIDLRLVPEDVISDSARSKLPPSLEERHRRTRDLRRLHSHLKWKHRQDYLLTAIRWARYPLISLQDKASGLDVQIVLSNDTSSSREFMQRYMDEYRYLLPTYSVIKAALDVRGLTDVFRGGIGSYSLFMMVVASIKHKPNPRNNAAAALHRFLGFWGNFKAEVNGVSIEPVELFNKSEQTVMHGKAMGHIKEGRITPLPPWMLTLRDPADETNDLGRKAIAWKHVQRTFQHLLVRSKLDMARNGRPSLLCRFVAPIYPTQKARRKRLTQYGFSLMAAGNNTGPIIDASKRLVRTGETEADAGADAEVDAGTIVQETPDFDKLAAIALAIRNGETVNAQSASESEAGDAAQPASPNSGNI